MITIPDMSSDEIREISRSCGGDCYDCPVCSQCRTYIDFMNDAAEDFENQCEVVLLELFEDPAACEALQKEVES